jgi:hypothetical protein
MQILPKTFKNGRELCTLSNVHFTDEAILRAIKNMKPSLSVGPDGLCAYFLKQISFSILQPLKTIFEVSFRTGIIPTMWRNAYVVPVFKKGDASSVKNYRPISLCCITCKLMESVINDTLSKYLVQNKLLSPLQYGFQRGKSCELQLLECKNKWTKSIDDKHTVDVIYIDFSKAFDKVIHQYLLEKLALYGIHGDLLKWIQSFLYNRQQQVKVNDVLSTTKRVTSGVPQGSILGPIFFLIYVNDITEQIKSSIYLFADDVKLFSLSENSTYLQNDLNTLRAWSIKWQLEISREKCSVLYIGQNNPKHEYKFSDLNIMEQTSVRDLGVEVDNKLDFKAHIHTVT